MRGGSIFKLYVTAGGRFDHTRADSRTLLLTAGADGRLHGHVYDTNFRVSLDGPVTFDYPRGHFTFETQYGPRRGFVGEEWTDESLVEDALTALVVWQDGLKERGQLAGFDGNEWKAQAAAAAQAVYDSWLQDEEGFVVLATGEFLNRKQAAERVMPDAQTKAEARKLRIDTEELESQDYEAGSEAGVLADFDVVDAAPDYVIEVFDVGDSFEAVATDASGEIIGLVRGLKDGTSIEPEGSTVIDGRRGEGIGTALYRALYEFARVRGFTHVAGHGHSDAASRVHESLARRYGYEYEPGYASDTDRGGYIYSLNVASRVPPQCAIPGRGVK
jgi:GNAT superfamily N-acetyltransferase